jgi:hypothetical protein
VGKCLLLYLILHTDDAVPLKRNLTPEQTQREHNVRSLGLLLVNSGFTFKNFEFALGPLLVCYLGALYAPIREADLALI